MRAVLTLVFIFYLATSCICYNSGQYAQYNTRNDLDWSAYTYSIDEGNCDGSKLADEDVTKDADEHTYKKTTYTWTGRNMFYLTCIRVLNRMPRDRNAGETRITEGGVGQGQVRIEMRSQDSQKLNFHVEIWGKPVNSAPNIAIVPSRADNVLYMNGKKYCECR
uniref:Vitellogenin domain-containing protein n=1 Tax=Dendroctonus ponderosae TaxID=77166 RepID=A0AAR5PXX2_DENPD